MSTEEEGNLTIGQKKDRVASQWLKQQQQQQKENPGSPHVIFEILEKGGRRYDFQASELKNLWKPDVVPSQPGVPDQRILFKLINIGLVPKFGLESLKAGLTIAQKIHTTEGNITYAVPYPRFGEDKSGQLVFNPNTSMVLNLDESQYQQLQDLVNRHSGS